MNKMPNPADNLIHDIVEKIRTGHNASAITALSAQRRISIAEARGLVNRWRDIHMPEST